MQKNLIFHRDETLAWEIRTTSDFLPVSIQEYILSCWVEGLESSEVVDAANRLLSVHLELWA